MRLIRTIVAYAASKEIEWISKDHATAHILANAANDTPLHTRGLKPRYDRHQKRKEFRKQLVERKLSWRADHLSRELNLMALNEAEAFADQQTLAFAADLYEAENKESFPLYLGASWHQANLSLTKEGFKPTASFSRSHGLRLAVAPRSLHYDIKRVYNDSRRIVLLDYQPITKGIAYVVWASGARKNKQPVVHRGALFEGAFVSGYSEEDIKVNVETIQMQARIMETNRALGVK